MLMINFNNKNLYLKILKYEWYESYEGLGKI